MRYDAYKTTIPLGESQRTALKRQCTIVVKFVPPNHKFRHEKKIQNLN